MILWHDFCGANLTWMSCFSTGVVIVMNCRCAIACASAIMTGLILDNLLLVDILEELERGFDAYGQTRRTLKIEI
ncbi:MAG: hypothetical protein CL927_16770 [Deltaproteobacteria bacterium]|nr:hypothetical protein [Deltaproteobacteria bacterium]